MGDVNDLRNQLEDLANEYEGKEFTPQTVEELRHDINNILQQYADKVFLVDGKFKTVEDVEILHDGQGRIKLLVTWNPTLYHQSYKEVKNFIHNTIGLNEETFKQLVQIEIEKMFLKMDKDGTLSELFQQEVQKYLGSYKSGLPRHMTPNYRLKEIVSQLIGEMVANTFDISVKRKDEEDGQK